MPDAEGLEPAKFVAYRSDPDAQARHEGCRLFVLDPAHDPIAFEAVAGYAWDARRTGRVQLGDELDAWLVSISDDYRRNVEDERRRRFARLDHHPAVDDAPDHL